MGRSATPVMLTVTALCSGFSALGLELLWGRVLALTFGGSQYAVATVLSAFMLGLGVGSAVGGRLADRVRHPAAVVVVLELGLVVIGPVLSILMLRLPEVAATVLPATASATAPAFLASRFVLGVVVLALPTLLMGATFPLLARAAASSLAKLHGALGFLYAANTAGGVLGAATAGLALLPMWGVPSVVAAAAAANAAAAAAAYVAHRTTAPDRAEDTESTAPPRIPPPLTLLTAAAASGALVLAGETLWHRALKLVLPNSTTTLTLLLTLTLVGLAWGAALVAPFLSRPRPLRRWSTLQLAAAGLLAAQAAALPTISGLVRAIRPEMGWARLLVPPLVVGGGLVLPVTLVLGAAWPLLLVAATPRLADGGSRVGKMGVANSVGAAIGAAAAGFVLLPSLGFGRAILVLAAAHCALALWGARQPMASSPRLIRTVAVVMALATAISALVAPRFGRILLPSMARGDTRRVVAYEESAAGTVVVAENPATGARTMYVDNNAAIGSSYEALKVVRMLGLLPVLLHPAPERVLVIGFGAGVTTATAAAAPETRTVDTVEIVPAVLAAAPLFKHLNHGVLDNLKVRAVVNDGRNHLLLRSERYDVITCDPVHPLYGSAPLYSRDFFRLCRQRLRNGGIVCQYLPLHRMPTAEFRRAVATFQEVFPETWVLFGLGHAMLAGSDTPLDLSWPRWQTRIAGHGLRQDLASSSLHHPAQIAVLLQLDPEACRAVAAGAPSTDLHPHLEFVAPAAYRPGLWEANARLLVEAYRSPIARIHGLPPGLDTEIQRLVAGKRLLLFSLLRRDAGDLEGALGWLRQANRVAGDDPEIRHYARQLAGETTGRPTR